MKIRCFCIVLIVSGALLTEVNNNRSLSGDNLLVVNNLQSSGNDSNLLIVFYVQIMPDDFVMQLHRF